MGSSLSRPCGSVQENGRFSPPLCLGALTSWQHPCSARCGWLSDRLRCAEAWLSSAVTSGHCPVHVPQGAGQVGLFSACATWARPGVRARLAGSTHW